MAVVELKFLGDIQVVRDGDPMRLPPSKKTRALLAYLALGERPFLREHLCELLWELPDDPRGSLRWSLSKLRRLVDDDDRARVVADRSSVAFDASDVAIDVSILRETANGALDTTTIENLESTAAGYRGNFLEGLELSSFHDFHSWCLGQREQAARAQAKVLRALVERLGDEPEQALAHARALVSIVPYEEEARAALIEILMSLRLLDEAEQQVRLGERMLEEAGVRPSGLMHRAWKQPASAASVPVEEPVPAEGDESIDAPAVSTRAAVAGGDRNTGPSGVEAHRASKSLVGRNSETQLLAGALDEAISSRRASVVLLRGEAGVGKTRLLEAVSETARVSDATVLQAAAFESNAIRPFALWIDALRRLDSDGDSTVFGADGNDNRDRLFGSLSDYVASAAESGPVVLAFDDLQWCDESSAAVLHYVARMNHDRPVLGVLAARDDELRDNAAMEQALRGLRHDGVLRDLKVEPLTPDAVRELIREQAPDADCERLSGQCGGNPLLAIELARAETAGSTADSLGDLVRERLARFDLDGAEVLHWAAVLAPRIDAGSLARMTGIDEIRVGEVLETAERHAMLEPADRGFRFSHDLVARSVYADIPSARRRVMHRRVAEMLEKETAIDLDHAADLAHHASQCGDPGLGARAMVSAGRLCLRFFANDDAVSLAKKGLQLAESLGDAERVCSTIDLRDVLLQAAPVDDWETAAREYVELAERALDHGKLAHARLGYHMASYLRWMHGHWAGAREETLQAERVTRSGSEEDHVIGMAEAAKCLAMLERDLTNADAMLMEAESLAGRHRIRHHAIPSARGILRYHENNLDEAEELFKEARTLCKSSGDRVNEFQANEFLTMIEFQRGRYEQARSWCAALLDIGEKLREGSEAPFARALDGLCRYAIDEEAGALDESIEELRRVDAKHRLAYTLTRAALIDLDRGFLESAEARAAEALECASELDRATETMLAHAALAAVYRVAGDADARARHERAIDAMQEAPVAQWARERTRSLISA